MTANPRAVAILALQGCSRAVDGQPCEVCLFRAAKDVAAVERGGRLAVVSAEDLQAWQERAEKAEAANARTRALHPSREEADTARQVLCVECAVPAPCPTRTALDETGEA